VVRLLESLQAKEASMESALSIPSALRSHPPAATRLSDIQAEIARLPAVAGEPIDADWESLQQALRPKPAAAAPVEQ
jgi:hypothetical protein